MMSILQTYNDEFARTPVPSVPKRYWVQYHQGAEAKSNGHDKNLCPYSNNLSEIFWKKGYDERVV